LPFALERTREGRCAPGDGRLTKIDSIAVAEENVVLGIGRAFDMQASDPIVPCCCYVIRFELRDIGRRMLPFGFLGELDRISRRRCIAMRWGLGFR
jgi:hypothetical protein